MTATTVRRTKRRAKKRALAAGMPGLAESPATGGAGGSATPDECSVDIFTTDIVSVIFCIIIKVLEAIMKALFIEVGAARPAPRQRRPVTG